MTDSHYPRSVVKAIQEVQNPPDNHPYEHHVGRVLCTLLPIYFSATKDYTITPEQIQREKNRPDFCVEILDEQNNLTPYLFAEVKKKQGDSIHKAMEQLGDAIVDTIDKKSLKESYSCFAIVVRGLEIGFFEYFNYVDDLDIEGIQNRNG